jgi:hypothetical protein
MTRTNKDLAEAFNEYERLYRKDFVNIVMSKIPGTNPNYKSFMSTVLECQGDHHSSNEL